MSKLQLEITQQEAPELLEFYSLKRARLIQENSAIFNKLNEYNAQIISLRKLINDESDDYPLGGSWNQKIQFVLRNEIEGLSVREISAKIAELEKVRGAEEIKRISNSVSPTLSMATGPIYDRRTNQNGEFIYSIRN